MRKILFLLLCISLMNNALAQQSKLISLSVRDEPLERVLGQIKSQTGISFFYNKIILGMIGKVTLQANQMELKTVLNELFRNTGVGYSIVGNIIVLVDKNNSKNLDSPVELNNDMFSLNTIHGIIFNANGLRLSGANIAIKRNRQGTNSNTSGEFSLRDVRSNDTLRISYIGYITKEIPITLQTEYNVVLQESNDELDAVKVQAYGTTTRRLAIGELGQINAKDIDKQALANPLLALRSQLPGVIVTPTSGYSNAPVRIEIRGRSSINSATSSDPLYIVDGVPIVQSNLSGIGSYATGSTGLQQAGFMYSGGQSPFATINPQDIESITVLKNAAATAMYGSRGGNGVIIINTKKGIAGTSKFDLMARRTFNSVIGRQSLLNIDQYIQMRREALRNDGLNATLATAPDLVLWNSRRNIEWQKELLQSNSSNVFQGAFSGGSELTQFRISGQYVSGEDLSPVFKPNTNKTATVNASFSHRSKNQKLSIGFSSLYGYNQVEQVAFPTFYNYAPNFPAIFDAEGNLNFKEWNAAGLSNNSFPAEDLLKPSTASTYTLNSSINIGYSIISGLKFGVTAGYNLGLNSNRRDVTIASQNPAFNPVGNTRQGDSRNEMWTIVPQVDFNQYIAKGQLNIILGGNLNSNSASGFTLLADGYTSDLLLKSINNARTTASARNAEQSKYVDLHGSIKYTWDEKYILEVTGNHDGSSNFGPGRQFGSFGSVGGAWIASEETWMKKALPSWVGLIKLKASRATTGQYPSAAYQYLSRWANSPTGGTIPSYSYNGVVPQQPISPVNQDFRWERTSETDLGLDLGFLDNRLNLHADWYSRYTGNQLTALPTPEFTGFSTVQGNSAAKVRNRGIEVSLNASLISNEKFSWLATANFTRNRNKLLDFPSIQYTPFYSRYKIGQSINEEYVFEYLGVDSQTGRRSYRDFDNNGIITQGNFTPGLPGDDRGISVNVFDPKFYAALTNSITYRNFNLSFLFAYINQTKAIPFNGTGGAFNLNVPVEVFEDHWQKPGDISKNPRFTTVTGGGDSFFFQSNGAFTNASYLRLQNLSFGYTTPEKIAKKLAMKTLRLQANMSNVFVISNYPGIDPDVQGTLPQPKIFNFELLLSF